MLLVVTYLRVLFCGNIVSYLILSNLIICYIILRYLILFNAVSLLCICSVGLYYYHKGNTHQIYILTHSPNSYLLTHFHSYLLTYLRTFFLTFIHSYFLTYFLYFFPFLFLPLGDIGSFYLPHFNILQSGTTGRVGSRSRVFECEILWISVFFS